VVESSWLRFEYVWGLGEIPKIEKPDK